MDIKDLYQEFLETEHHYAPQTDSLLSAVMDEQSADLIADSIEAELHSGFVSGFIAGVTFMKGALR